MELTNYGELRTVIYEVNLEIDCQIENEFVNWLKLHIAQMLCISGFRKASLYSEEKHPGITAGRIALSVKYYVDSRAQLQAYFDHHADSMRSDCLGKFDRQFTATRRILQQENYLQIHNATICMDQSQLQRSGAHYDMAGLSYECLSG